MELFYNTIQHYLADELFYTIEWFRDWLLQAYSVELPNEQFSLIFCLVATFLTCLLAYFFFKVLWQFFKSFIDWGINKLWI